MARPSVVSYEDVKRAWLKLVSSGKHASVDAIYQNLGNRGSKTTIHKHRSQLQEELANKGVEILPSTIPKSLIPLIEEAWGQAVAAGGEVFAEERNKYEDQIRQLELRAEELTADVRAREETLADQSITIEALNGEKDQLSRELQSCRERLSDSQNQIGALQDNLERQHESHKSAVASLEELHNAQRSEWEREREHLNTLLTEAQNRAEIEIKRSDEQMDHWLRQVALERENTLQERALREADTKRLNDELTIARHREISLVSRAERLEKANQKLVEEHEQFKGQFQEALETERTKLYQSDQDRARLQTDLEVRNERIDSLRERLESLEDKAGNKKSR